MAKLVRVPATQILNAPLTADQRTQLARLAVLPDADINSSDIPPLTEEQLAGFHRRADISHLRGALDVSDPKLL